MRAKFRFGGEERVALEDLPQFAKYGVRPAVFAGKPVGALLLPFLVPRPMFSGTCDPV